MSKRNLECLPFRRNAKRKEISKTSLVIHHRCPFELYIARFGIDETKVSTLEYKNLCGILVHAHIKRIHASHRHDGRYYYKSEKNAVNSFRLLWSKALEKHSKDIKDKNEKESRKYLSLGSKCLHNYWIINERKKDPTNVELKLSIPLKNGFVLTGIIDQIREIDIEQIRKIRPDAVKDNKLNPDYDPVLVIDLKTGPLEDEFDSSLIEDPKTQSLVHTNLQSSVYALLYKKHFGKWPIAFTFWQLEENRFQNVFGDSKEAQNILWREIDRYIESITKRYFKKNIRIENCRQCAMSEKCKIFSQKENKPKEKKPDYKQRRLRLKYKTPEN